ncbi:recQ [Mytilus coruscus]|uniref:RecQ n=1 Tax=Mytilus coruscus TaxID=42192 RepID=A0A6J8E5N4_MYTCO|nr:recQ [Mytilus coruscus]
MQKVVIDTHSVVTDTKRLVTDIECGDRYTECGDRYRVCWQKQSVVTDIEGKEFRKDYSRLGELRSILANAVMLALTATATKQSRKEIACYLQMQDYKLVLSSCDRSNIFYFLPRGSIFLDQTFTWLISVIQLKGVSTKDNYIPLSNIKACSQIYALFLDKLDTDHSYCGQPSSKIVYSLCFTMLQWTKTEKYLG